MDIQRAIRLARLAETTDATAEVSKSATDLRHRLDELAGNPSDTNFQTNAAHAVDRLKGAFETALLGLSPEEVEQIAVVAGAPLFTPSFVDEVELELRDSPATPATARDRLVALLGAREGAFANLRQFLTTAEALGWDGEELTEWTAEVGFKIPRALFDNRFDGLLGELRYLRRLLSHISEAHGESVQDIRLSGLSTTDPLIVLGVSYVLAKEIGGLTAWALAQWKTVEEIRKLRADATKLPHFGEEEIEAFFGSKLRKQLDEGIKEEVARQVIAVRPAARKNELKNALTIDLREFLARIERGLTVEVRLLNEAGVETNEDDEVGGEGNEGAAEFRSIAAGLKFSPPTDLPLLQIVHLPPE